MTREKRAKRSQNTTRIATWNLQGKLSDEVRQKDLFEDMRERKIGIAGLQETLWNRNIMITSDHGVIHTFESSNETYRGLGFYMSTEWRDRLISLKIVNERICLARFRAFSEPGVDLKADFTVINIYGPTSMRTRNQQHIEDAFFAEVRRVYEEEKRGTTAVFVLGDFNCKIGRATDNDKAFMGNYGKGERNENGEALRDFLEETNLYLANTHFKHRDRQIATWHGGRPNKKETKRNRRSKNPGLHNQIDYIAVPQHMMSTAYNAKAYLYQRYRSDHSLVVASFELQALYKHRRIPQKPYIKRDFAALQDPETQEAYQQVVWGYLQQQQGPSTPEETHESLKKAVLRAAEDTLPRAPTKINGKIQYHDDPEICALSKKQLSLTKGIYHNKKGKTDPARRLALKEKRNQVFKRLRARQRELNEQRLNLLATELEKSGPQAIFEYSRIMSKSSKEGFKLYDANGSMLCRQESIMKSITEYYREFYSRAGDEAIGPWRGEPRRLANEISFEEVQAAAKRLKNNRAVGPDGVAGELIKYGGDFLHNTTADMLNAIFEKHETISELKAGHLFPLNKPAKSKTADNTRPLVFLSIIRKVLSNIVLARIKPKVEQFLSPYQHAYRQHRSTTEVTWTVQWIAAQHEKYSEIAHILGIDLSKAFDCLSRAKLLNIIAKHQLATDDEMRIITFLISETTLQVKLGQTLGEIFSTIIGTPQGDCLSCILFLIYLEEIMREANLEQHLTAMDITLAYADDVDIALVDSDLNRTAAHAQQAVFAVVDGCPCAACRAHHLEAVLTTHFATYDMQVNAGKTTHEEFRPGFRKDTKRKTLGSFVSPEKELEIRRTSANFSMNSMCRIWQRGPTVSPATRMRLYKACIKSRLTFNAATTAYTLAQLEKLNSTHRRQLRRALGVFYPQHITDAETYARSESRPIAIDILEARWTMLGHILRGDRSAPAYKVMVQYFQRRYSNDAPVRKQTRRGRVLTTLPRLLHLDLEKLTEYDRRNLFAVTGLENGTQLVTLRAKAQNRQLWRKGINKLIEESTSFWDKRIQAAHDKRAAAPAPAPRVRRRQRAITDFF